jgi:hypothetical protein
LDKTTERKYRITGYPQRREYLLSSSGWWLHDTNTDSICRILLVS